MSITETIKDVFGSNEEVIVKVVLTDKGLYTNSNLRRNFDRPKKNQLKEFFNGCIEELGK